MLLNEDIEKELVALRKEVEAFNSIVREACLIFDAANRQMPPLLAAWWENHKAANEVHEVHGYRSEIRK